MGLSEGPRKLATTTGQRCKVLGGCWQENDFNEGSCPGQASAGSWPTRAGNRPTEMGYFKSSRLCLRGQHAISIHFPNSKGGGRGKYQEAKMNLGTFAPPCKKGCVQAHRQPAPANWTSSPALNLASWKSFFKYILFNLLKSRPACGREGLLAFVGPGTPGQAAGLLDSSLLVLAANPQEAQLSKWRWRWAGSQGHHPQAEGTC